MREKLKLEKPDASLAPSDEELVKRVRAGRQENFNELVRRHRPEAEWLAHSISGHAAEADDVVQEAFIKAYRCLDGFRGQSSFKTWLMKLVRNTAIDARRRRAVEEKWLHQNEGGSPARCQGQSPTPLDALLGEERRQLVSRTFRRHTTRFERFVWNLHFEEGMTYSEIADLFEGMTAETVRNIVRNVRTTLRKRLLQPE